jgi:hypothetical protein
MSLAARQTGVLRGQESRSGFPARHAFGVRQESLPYLRFVLAEVRRQSNDRGKSKGGGFEPSSFSAAQLKSILYHSQLQYESELVTSPPFLDPSAHMIAKPVDDLMNRTDPSPKAALAPPG